MNNTTIATDRCPACGVPYDSLLRVPCERCCPDREMELDRERREQQEWLDSLPRE